MNRLRIAIIGETKQQARYWLNHIKHLNQDGIPIALGADIIKYENVEYLVLPNSEHSRGYLVDQIFVCGTLSDFLIKGELALSLLRASCVPEEFQIQYIELD